MAGTPSAAAGRRYCGPDKAAPSAYVASAWERAEGALACPWVVGQSLVICDLLVPPADQLLRREVGHGTER